ncbi:hypothetical protein PMAYCL1PPCAC_24368, partial [Pristionchus mayeri]
QTVGYHIRLEQKTSPITVLTYCTSGVLLRMLTADELARDCTHIILDEVHEREQNTDYLLIALKQALRRRNDLKVILMSATMEGNLEMFLNYFKEFNIAHVDIPSRLYPVTNFHLADVMALTAYTPPESIYGGLVSFSNGFGGGFNGGPTSGFGGNNHSNSFSMGTWGGRDSFASATNWNNSDANMHPQSSHSYHKPPLTPSNSFVSPQSTAAGVRAVQSAANLSFGGNGAGASASQGNANDSQSNTYLNLAQKLVSASGNAPNPLASSPQQPLQQGFGTPSSANNKMHRCSSMGGNYAPPQSQYAQQPQYNNMQQMQPGSGGAGGYGAQLSWDSPSGYANTSSDVVDLPMDEDDRSMTMQANQQLYGGYGSQQCPPGGGYGGGQSGFGRGGTAGGVMQPMQQNYQGGNGYGGGFGQPQMYGMQSMQQPHYHPTGAAGHGMHHYQYQSQPNMQMHQSQPQWPQQQLQPSQPPQQPMFYVPDGGAGANSGYFVQPGMNGGPSMTGVSTHASSYIHRSTSAAASLNDADQYGMGLREEENARNSMANHIKHFIPNRPPIFCEQALDALYSVQPILDRKTFTQFYRSMGGAQWDESVDVELAHVTVKYLMDSPIPGAILVFLPGYEDIQALKDKIAYDRYDGLRPALCLLHSQLNSNDQQRVFEPTRQGERKVILSTNIAEASLTIDDVVFVIDCGKAKEKTYDHASRISQLKCVWIAKSNAEQRRGRAGRCRPGFCFRLYSDEEFEKMLPSQVAEMKRSAIHDVCLHAKMFAPEQMSVKAFLELAPEPPEAKAVESSLQFLEQLGALYTEQEDETSFFYGSKLPRLREQELTQLGRLVAHLPLDPQLARLLLFGYALRCFNPIVTLVALLSHRDPFTLAVGDEKQAALSARDSFAHRDFSDHLMILRAFSAYAAIPSNNQAQMKLCREKYLSAPTLKMVNGIRRQLLMELRRIRFINEIDGALDDPYLNEYSNKWPMVQAAIVAGSYPCIGFVKGSKMRKIRTYTDTHSQLHPSSSLKRQMLSQEKRQEALQKYYMGEPTIEYLAFQEFVKIDEGLTLRTATAIPSVTIFLFAGPIRLSREKLQSYFVATREETLQEEAEGQDRDFFQPRDILELESWLSVKGCMSDFIRMMQLRFKVMYYVLNVMRRPQHINEEESKMLLSTLSNVLEIEHKTKGFNEVSDVYVRYSYPGSNGQNPLRKTEKVGGYDFGANTSSSSNSHKDEKKKAETVAAAAKQCGNNGNSSGGNSFFNRPAGQFSQYSQPFNRNQQVQQPQFGGNQRQERGEMKGRERSEADNKMNWRQGMTPSPSPPLQQQQQLPNKKQYPDPYRDERRERDERSSNTSRAGDQQQPHPFSKMEFIRPPARPKEEKREPHQRGNEERGNGYNREERNERNERNEGAAKWRDNQRRGSTVASRLQDKRGSRTEDYGSGTSRQSGRNQRGYEDEDDVAVPEDPQPNRGLGFGPQQKRPEERREYGSKYGNQDKRQNYGGQARNQHQNQKAEPPQEEDWGKEANAPSFFSTEGGQIGKKKGGRTFVNSNFMGQFKGMHSDRMDNKNGGGSREDERDGVNYKQRGSRTTRGD